MKALVNKFQHHFIAKRYISAHTVDAYRRDIAQFLDFREKPKPKG